ncbi:MAG: cytidylate kinase family protein, partial [Desulfobacterales bacterium]
RFMQKNYEMSERRATRLVRGEDKRRKTLYQKLGKTDYDNPFLYHLVLNMSKLTLEEAKTIVCNRINA